MSLLLDALKRAAEQKAAKTREDKPEAADAQDTVLDGSQDTEFDGGSAETELDASQDTVLESSQDTEFDGSSEQTELDGSQDTVLESSQDTMFDGSSEQTELDASQDTVFEDGSEETLLDPSQDTVFDDSRDTEFDAFPQTAIQVEDEDDGSILQHQLEDETELSQLLREAAEDADNEHTSVEAGSLSEGDANLRHFESADDHEVTNVQARPAKESDRDDSSLEDDSRTEHEDMSLLLVEREPTQLTDPQRPQDALQALQAEAPTAADLGMGDTTKNRSGEDRTPLADGTHTRTANTATTGMTTATANLHNATPADSGAMQSHAPDNYDRTLMRLPNDETSKLFGGMKSDPDQVMTPDYAKRIFRSKSTALRFQHLKAYSGIAIAILLAVGVYGIIEFQAETDSIDANLLPLKNDPFPGTIPSANPGAEAETPFAEAEVNERALEILQSAENIDEQPATDEALAAEPGESGFGEDTPNTSEAPVEVAAIASSQPVAGESVASPVDEIEQPIRPADDPVAPEPIATSKPTGEQKPVIASDSTVKTSPVEVRVVTGGTSQPSTMSTGNRSSELQIQTSERLEQKHVLLREAYDAYQLGDDDLALQRYNRVLAIDPGNRNALLARAAIYVQSGDSATAIEDYQTLLLANPKDSLAMASLLAVANYSPVETETQLKLMIRDEPDSPHLNFALANAYAAQKRWQEAQGHYFTALQNNPEDPNYAYNLAVSLEHIAQPQAAVSYYRRALENYNKGLATFSREAVDRRLEKLAKS